MREVQLGDILTAFTDAVTLSPDAEYSTAGILNRGRGLFARPAVRGRDVTYDRYHRLHPGLFVYSRLFAWEGALTVVDDAFAGRYVSPEFPTFEIDRRRASPEYVAVLCRWQDLWTRVRATETGMGGRRKRVHPEALMTVKVPLPTLLDQRRIVDLMAAVDEQVATGTRSTEAAYIAMSTARDTWLEWADLVPLSELCSIESTLVSPLRQEFADMPHIGVEAIERRSGRLLATRSASEDGVTSGKYLVNPRDVVYSKIRPELRKATFPAMHALCSADAYPLRPLPGIAPEYLLEVLLSSRFSEAAVARSGRTKMPKINRMELLSIGVPKSSPSEQRRIGHTLAELRRLASAATDTAIAGTRAWSAILADLLSGEHQIPESYDRFLTDAA